ncbi:siroheme synthase [Lichenicoccus sp.]|uniref:siroheme synthase n=1 Tax=Lichenicoccus sp. TaxID=2781899 RepID=UPI003D14F56F
MSDTQPGRLPVFLDLDGRRALLLGAGEAAERRAATLLACGALLVRATEFDEALLDGCAIAIGAADEDARARDHPLQVQLRAMAAAARRRGIPHNVVDQPELGSFITPAVVERAPLSIAISSGGAAPVLARLLRARIETLVPPGFGRLAALAGRLQDETRRVLPDVLQRRRMLEAALSGPVAELVLEGREVEAEAAYRRALDDAARGASVQRGFVHLVHPGPGPADLLTLRALRLLGEADVIVHGAAESPAVLEVARRDAARVVVLDAEAPALLVRLAGDGGKLVRLSPTDADARALCEAGVDHAVVPGVASVRD